MRGLASAAGQAASLAGIRAFYNGYLFGGQALYNPWSVLSFLDRGDGELWPYWIETRSNDLVRELLLTGPEGIQTDFDVLLAGGTLDKPIDENNVMVLPRTAGQPGVVLELKRVDTEAGETREKAFTAALRQIREWDYAAELRERGAVPIHPMAAVFEGKRVFVRAVEEKTAKKATPVRKGARRTGRS